MAANICNAALHEAEGRLTALLSETYIIQEFRNNYFAVQENSLRENHYSGIKLVKFQKVLISCACLDLAC
jgi:hypothetical protein